MSGQSGFSQVAKNLHQQQKRRFRNLAIKVTGFEYLIKKGFVAGIDISTGSPVKAALSARRGQHPSRKSLSDFDPGYSTTGRVMVLREALQNSLGTFECSGVLGLGPEDILISTGVCRVSPPVQRTQDSWLQAITHLETDRATVHTDYHDLVSAVMDGLQTASDAQNGVVVRGWHPRSRKAGVMAFEADQVFDRTRGQFLSGVDAYQHFCDREDVFVHGLSVLSNGSSCLREVANMMAKHGPSIIWEVIPKTTYFLTGGIPEQAGLGSGTDWSQPYRIPGRQSASGYLESIIVLSHRDQGMWPRFAAPMTSDGEVVSMSFVQSPHVTPTPRCIPASPSTSQGWRPAGGPERNDLEEDLDLEATDDGDAPLPPDMSP